MTLPEQKVPGGRKARRIGLINSQGLVNIGGRPASPRFSKQEPPFAHPLQGLQPYARRTFCWSIEATIIFIIPLYRTYLTKTDKQLLSKKLSFKIVFSPF